MKPTLHIPLLAALICTPTLLCQTQNPNEELILKIEYISLLEKGPNGETVNSHTTIHPGYSCARDYLVACAALCDMLHKYLTNKVELMNPEQRKEFLAQNAHVIQAMETLMKMNSTSLNLDFDTFCSPVTPPQEAVPAKKNGKKKR